MASARRIDVAAMINGAAISSLQLRVFVLCGLVSVLDGFDTQAIAFVAPSLRSVWNLAPSSMGPVFSSGLLGGAVGAVLMGRLADRVGRRAPILLSVALFGIFTLASARANGLYMLLVLRFLAGIGLGGALPNLIAPAYEYAPDRVRSTVVVMTLWGFPLGAVLGGFLSVSLIDNYGWRSVFYAGGALPLLALPILALALPESIRFLVLRARSNEQTVRILTRINPQVAVSAHDVFVLPEEATGESSLRQVLAEGRALGTILLWIALAASLLLAYLLLNWIPLLLRESGLPTREAVLGTVVFNFAGILGSALIARFADSSDQPLRPLIAGYVLASLAAASTGFVPNTFWPLMMSIFLTGFCLIGTQMPLTSFIAAFYPTYVRANGLGWAQAAGRIGSIVGPALAGWVMAGGMPPRQLLRLTGLPALLCAAALLILMQRSTRSTGSAVRDIADSC